MLTVAEAVNAATECFRSGRLDQAGSLCGEILSVDPVNAEALHILAFIAWQSGSRSDAVGLLERAATANPNNADILSNLGGFYRECGQRDHALECFLRAMAVDPKSFRTAFNLGVVLVECGRYKEAVDAYEKARSLMPTVPAVYNGLAIAFTALGRIEEAKRQLTQALTLDANNVEALSNLGAIESRLGNPHAAIRYYQEAIAKGHRHFETYKNLGDAHATLAQHGKAVAAYKLSLEEKPDYYNALFCLASAYANTGNTKAATDAFARLQGLNPKSLIPIWGAGTTCLLSAFADEEELRISRERYAESLADIESCLKLTDSASIDDAQSMVGSLQPFYLASQAMNDRDLQKRYGLLVSRIMAAKYPQWATPLLMPPVRDGERIRVGFASRYFYQHANWKMLLNGWTQGLDRKTFSLYGYSTGAIADDATERAREVFNVFVEGKSFEELASRIRQDNLHVLIFSETGMDPITLRLASLRLAPVQCVSWGHPETSGLPTVDYYLSSDLMEPEDAQQYYTEELVRLPNLSTYYVPLTLPPDPSRLESLGVRADAVRYLCLQALHKYLPRHDHILTRIAARVPDAQFIFIASPEGAEAKLRARLEKAFAEASMNMSDRVVFLPPLPNEEYRGLCAQGHVFLDSLDWSGCTTTLEAIEQSLVPVTLPGQFMRGRHTSAILTMMGITDTIADSVDGYVELAVRLGQDHAWRKDLSEAIERKRYLTYRDPEAITGLEEFLTKVTGPQP